LEFKKILLMTIKHHVDESISIVWIYGLIQVKQTSSFGQKKRSSRFFFPSHWFVFLKLVSILLIEAIKDSVTCTFEIHKAVCVDEQLFNLIVSGFNITVVDPLGADHSKGVDDFL
jgi:hypothetical protein